MKSFNIRTGFTLSFFPGSKYFFSFCFVIFSPTTTTPVCLYSSVLHCQVHFTPHPTLTLLYFNSSTGYLWDFPASELRYQKNKNKLQNLHNVDIPCNIIGGPVRSSKENRGIFIRDFCNTKVLPEKEKKKSKLDTRAIMFNHERMN